MNNTVTAAEIKRRGMAAMEEGLRRGPVHIVKRNKSAAGMKRRPRFGGTFNDI